MAIYVSVYITLTWKFAEQRKIMSCMMSNILCDIFCRSSILKILPYQQKYKVTYLGLCIPKTKYALRHTKDKYVKRKFVGHERVRAAVKGSIEEVAPPKKR